MATTFWGLVGFLGLSNDPPPIPSDWAGGVAGWVRAKAGKGKGWLWVRAGFDYRLLLSTLTTIDSDEPSDYCRL